MMKLTAFVLFMVFARGGNAQSFVLGATREEVRAAFPRPPELFSVPFQRLFSAEQEVFVSQAGSYQDIWEVKTQSNLIRMSMSYGADASRSRLHPVMRLQNVVFTPDMNATGRVLLNQIEPIRRMCQQACSVVAERDRSVEYLRIYVCAKKGYIPDDAAQDSYEGYSGEHRYGAFTACAIVEYGQHPELHIFALKNVPFTKLNVDQIRLTGMNLLQIGQIGELYPLGSWTTGEQ